MKIERGQLTREKDLVKAIFARVQSFALEQAIAEAFELEAPKFFTDELKEKCSSSKG